MILSTDIDWNTAIDLCDDNDLDLIFNVGFDLVSWKDLSSGRLGRMIVKRNKLHTPKYLINAKSTVCRVMEGPDGARIYQGTLATTESVNILGWLSEMTELELKCFLLSTASTSNVTEVVNNLERVELLDLVFEKIKVEGENP